MKTLIAILALSIATFVNAQDSLNGKVVVEEVKVTNVAIAMTVDNYDELESFKPDDLRETLEDAESDEKITFELKYEYPDSIRDGKASRSFSYKIEGNTNDIDNFIESVEYIQNNAKKVLNKKTRK